MPLTKTGKKWYFTTTFKEKKQISHTQMVWKIKVVWKIRN